MVLRDCEQHTEVAEAARCWVLHRDRWLDQRIEELLLNTVKHGHRGGSDAPVWITLASVEGAIRVTYEDQAPPFNPFATATREMLEALAGTRREGGLGVMLAHGLTTETDYAYLFGRNRIRVALPA